MKHKKRGLLILVGIVLVASLSLLSADIFSDIFKPSGTGRASSGTQDVRITVAGTNPPNIDSPNAPSGLTHSPIESGVRPVNLNVVVTDIDGVSNINDASLLARVTRNAVTRTASCSLIGNIDADTKNYSCTINMQYYDSAGAWDLYVEIRDQENNMATQNIIGYFTYDLLKSMTTPLSPSELNWASLTPGTTNQLSSNDPTTVTNTGNYAGNVFVRAYDLQGETNGAEFIFATSFSTDSSTGGAPPAECNVGVTAVALGPDGTNIDTGIYATPGQSGSNNALMYYCITSVPFVSSQVYSTSIRGAGFSWIVNYP